jgi:RNA polymerase sigma-70 factor, ECF subfamily
LSDKPTRIQNLDPRSDEALLLAVGRGDLDAFELLVQRHQDFAWQIAFRFLGNRDSAQDIVQDAFLRLLNSAPKYQPTARFRTYFSRIISNLCLDHVRKTPLASIDEAADIPCDTPLPDERVELQQKNASIQQAIAKLPPNQRLAIILKYYENNSYVEIAEVLACTEKAVERLLARARATLLQQLKDWL